MPDRAPLRPILFDCPLTGYKVQGLIADSPADLSGHHYESVHCSACNGVHLVDVATERVIGATPKR